MRQALIEWTGAQGAGMFNVMHFTDQAPTQDILDALEAYLTASRSAWATGVSAQVQGTMRVIDPVTGGLQGFESGTAPAAVTGNGAGSGSGVAADATQVVMQWRTGYIRPAVGGTGGRELRGRSFLPGINRISLSGGNVGNTAITQYEAGAAALLIADVGFGVWGRPRGGAADGILMPVTAYSVWAEAGVLRRRRK